MAKILLLATVVFSIITVGVYSGRLSFELAGGAAIVTGVLLFIKWGEWRKYTAHCKQHGFPVEWD